MARTWLLLAAAALLVGAAAADYTQSSNWYTSSSCTAAPDTIITTPSGDSPCSPLTCTPESYGSATVACQPSFAIPSTYGGVTYAVTTSFGAVGCTGGAASQEARKIHACVPADDGTTNYVQASCINNGVVIKTCSDGACSANCTNATYTTGSCYDNSGAGESFACETISEGTFLSNNAWYSSSTCASAPDAISSFAFAPCVAASCQNASFGSASSGCSNTLGIPAAYSSVVYIMQSSFVNSDCSGNISTFFAQANTKCLPTVAGGGVLSESRTCLGTVITVTRCTSTDCSTGCTSANVTADACDNAGSYWSCSTAGDDSSDATRLGGAWVAALAAFLAGVLVLVTG